jgi:hypothetical protein
LNVFYLKCLVLDREFTNLYLGRWSNVIQTVSDLLDVELLARRSWNLQKFLDGARDRNGDGDSGDSSDDEVERKVGISMKGLRKVDEGMQKPVFWGMCFIVWCVNYAMETVAAWLEGCPCHPETHCAPTRWKRQKKYMQQSGATFDARGRQPSCPANGCRASSLAAGEHRDVMGKAINGAHGAVLSTLCRDTHYYTLLIHS